MLLNILILPHGSYNLRG